MNSARRYIIYIFVDFCKFPAQKKILENIFDTLYAPCEYLIDTRMNDVLLDPIYRL